MKRSLKRMLAAGLGAALCLSTVPVTALAQEAAAGTPYAADGTYNVSVPHVVVNQVFGASDDAEAVTHSFIELYNQSDAAVSLDGWYAYYKSSPDGGDTAWSSLALQGTIAAKGHFLIRCGLGRRRRVHPSPQIKRVFCRKCSGKGNFSAAINRR